MSSILQKPPHQGTLSTGQDQIPMQVQMQVENVVKPALEVRRIVLGLKNYMSPGSDKLPRIIFKCNDER